MATAGATTTVEEEQLISIQEQLTIPILLADRLIKAAQEAECNDLTSQATQLSQLLRAAVRLTATNPSLYDRPIRRITTEVCKTVDRALVLVRKCKNKKANILRQVFSITITADFRRVSHLLENSLGDVKWLLSIFDSDSESGTVLSLPPIASNDPTVAWVWSYIASIQSGLLKQRIESCQELSSLAQLNDRNKKLIIEENGVPPLLKLLKESTSPDAQIAAALALCNLAVEQESVGVIAKELGVQMIVKALNESPPMRVQVELVKLVSRMAELDENVKEDFGRENVSRVMVTLLGMDEEERGRGGGSEQQLPHKNATSLHSLVQVAKNESNGNGSSNSFKYVSTKEKEREKEVESPDMKMLLKVNCAMALWKLAKGSLLNARKITETKALLCLAKIIEKEKGELQIHCLNTVLELAVVAEENPDLRRTAFKLNSPSARAVLDQLLRVINEGNTALLLIPAIKAIGCLARTFPAKETRIVEPLVAQLGHRDHDVAHQAVLALTKFVSLDNFNRVDHSKVIVEFNGVPKLMNLLRANDRNQFHEVLLLCLLAVHVGNNKAFEQARALSVLEGAARYFATQSIDLRELFAKAVHHLTLYQAGTHTHIQM